MSNHVAVLDSRMVPAQPSAGPLSDVPALGCLARGYRQRCAEAGIAHHLLKPAELPELDTILSAILRATGKERAGGT